MNRRLLLATLLAWVTAAVGVSLFPLRDAGLSAGASRTLDGFWTWSLADDTLATLGARLLAFVPVGMLARRLHGRSGARGSIFAIAIVVVVAVATEVGQALFSTRHARLGDLVLTVAFGASGAAFGSRWSGRGVAVGLACVGNVLVLAALIVAHSGVEPDGWDPDYPLLFGNEATGDKPWLGVVRAAAIFAREIPAASAIRSTAAGANATEELERLGPTAWRWGPTGLAFPTPTLVRHEAPAREITSAVAASRALSIWIDLTSGHPEQEGPARIVSISRSPLERNVTLGEVRGRLVLRVRTPRGGDNGARLEARTDAPVLSAGPHRVVVTYARGRARFFIDGREALASPPAYEVIHATGSDPVPVALFAAIVFFWIGAVSGFFTRLHLGLVSCSLALIPLACSAIATIGLDRACDVGFTVAALAAPFAGVACGRVLAARRRRDGR